MSKPMALYITDSSDGAGKSTCEEDAASVGKSDIHVHAREDYDKHTVSSLFTSLDSPISISMAESSEIGEASHSKA